MAMNKEQIMHFVGVTTQSSSSVVLFPHWAQALGITDARLHGVNFKLHDEPVKYRQFVKSMITDEQVRGALITTHKIDLFYAAKDLFHSVDSLAAAFGEVSCIVRGKGGSLRAFAIDPISSGMSLERFLPCDYFSKHNADVLILGAGGSMLALCCALFNRKNSDQPMRIVVANRSQARLEQAKTKLNDMALKVKIEYFLCPEPEDNDAVLNDMKPYTLVVNATGLGKDRPGSPLTDKAVFPSDSVAWDLNYRGDLLFLKQARAQAQSGHLRIVDGWDYFIIGWGIILGLVYGVPVDDAKLEMLKGIADGFRK